MNFIMLVLALGAGMITVNYIMEFVNTLQSKPADPTENDCRKTNTMHTWYYGEDTYLRCKVCNRKPFDD